MSIPKVSILIPAFNRKEYITECIQSALDQTFTDFEVVVVDNASDDGTWEICQEFAEADQRVRIFRNESNIGPVRNWIRCTEEACGEYSKFLFSDDLIFPTYLEKLLPLLDAKEVAFAYSAVLIGACITTGEVAYNMENSGKYSATQYFKLLKNSLAPLSPGCAIFRTLDVRKNLLINLPTNKSRDFARHGAGPDVMIFALCAMNYSTIATINEPLALFRSHENSFSIRNDNNQVADGYRSALSWFFLKYHGKYQWLEYISAQWGLKVVLKKKWISPQLFSKEFEGKGHFLDAVLITLTFGKLYIFRKIRSIF